MDTGHVKQVATFEKLLGFCNAHGAMFNPSKQAIKATALANLLTSAQQSIEAVRTAHTVYKNAVIVRNETFNKVPKFMTRIVNALASSGATAGTVEEAYRFIKKFYKPPKKKDLKLPDASAAEPSVTRSTSQMDYDSKAENFLGMVKVVSMEPLYQPNESDLQVSALVEFASHLKQLNAAVIQTHVTLSNTRANRDSYLYKSIGIHGVALMVKRYIKGVFGYQSVPYNQIRSLRFEAKKLA